MLLSYRNVFIGSDEIVFIYFSCKSSANIDNHNDNDIFNNNVAFLHSSIDI